MNAVLPATIDNSVQRSRLRTLQAVGMFSGLAAGAWLGGAEAPIKMASPDVSPLTVSLIMVCGVFLARWSVPALIRGTSSVGSDVRQAPHLIIWAVLAGCMWSVANTMTIYAIRTVGLSIAFPLWNTNSLLGIFWGFILFNELHYAGWKRWAGVLGGALAMFAGATLLAIASTNQVASAQASRGVIAALTAGILWGTMYIPYRKAYLSGMNPLSFVTFFTIGEFVTMAALAVTYRGPVSLWRELLSARAVVFWLMLGGFVWVIGDLFQQYAAKYVGISRGIPLSNTNQLWGLLWGIFVFHELHGGGHRVYAEVIGGSILMSLGALGIALSSAGEQEHASWQDAAVRESERYGIEADYVRTGMQGVEFDGKTSRRTLLDWVLIAGTSSIFIALAVIAKVPSMDISLAWTAGIATAMLALLVSCGLALWRTTRFR